MFELQNQSNKQKNENQQDKNMFAYENNVT